MASTHGMSASTEYHIWSGMKQRCLNPVSESWERYGGAGVTVCARWSGDDGFVNFLADMGRRPPGKSLDRINPFGNYEPGNCRWADATVQHYNTRIPRAAIRGRLIGLRMWRLFGCVFTEEDFEGISRDVFDGLIEELGPLRGLPLRLVDMQLDTSDDSDDPFRRLDVADWESAA